MKKSLNLLFIIALSIILLCGCGNKDNNNESITESNSIHVEEQQKETIEDIYMKVLKDEIKFVYEDGSEMLFSEYVDDAQLKDIRVSYALCDFDRDEENEMIINIRDMFYLILNYEDEIVYGFMDVYRGIEMLRVDGTYVGSGGADAHAMCRTTFDKTKRTNIILAESDWGKYKIDGKSVSKAEYDEFYEKEFTSKELVEFIMFDEHYNK